MTDAKSVSAALASVVTAVAEGSITPGEAESLARVLETQMRVVEFEALAQRVDELEKAQTQPPQATEPGDDSTMKWIASNYSNQTPDSGTTAEARPEHVTATKRMGSNNRLRLPALPPHCQKPKGNPL